MSRPIPNASKGYDGLQMQITGSNTMSGWTDAMLNPTLAGLASMWDNNTATRPPWLPANGWWCYTDGAGLKRVFIFDGQRDVEIFRITAAGALTIASVSVATTALAGIVRMATIAETTDMSLSNVAVTPQGLNNLKASETVIGLAEKATNTEVLTGTDDVRFVSPKGLQSLTATTGRKGIVQLSSAVNSTSEALAATSKAVKTAYDLADTANNKPTVTVVNSWTDASTTKAGAVGLAKWLYDNKANKTDAVPKPTSTNWVIIEGPAASNFLPSGGTWAYFALKINSPNGIGVTCTQSAGVAPGGSRVGAGTDTGAAFGFAWKIA